MFHSSLMSLWAVDMHVFTVFFLCLSVKASSDQSRPEEF